MNAATVIPVIILIAIVFFAVRYIVKEKRKGARCIGCPAAGNCHDDSKKQEEAACCCCGTEAEKAGR